MNYFDKFSDPKEVVNESAKYTIRNLIDAIRIANDGTYKNYNEKLIRIIDEFTLRYEAEDRQKEAILDAINERIQSKKAYQPVDIIKFDETMRLMDRNMIFSGDDVLLRYKEKLNKEGKTSLEDLELFYFVFVRLQGINAEYFKDYCTKYFLPVFIDNKYICWIVFDEVKVYRVLVLCSTNQYIINGIMKSVPLKVDCRIFKK